MVRSGEQILLYLLGSGYLSLSRLFLAKIVDEPEEINLILSLSVLCGFQGGYFLVLLDKFLSSRESILEFSDLVASCTPWVMISWSWDLVKTKIGSSGDTSACCATWAKLFILANAISDIRNIPKPSLLGIPGQVLRAPEPESVF